MMVNPNSDEAEEKPLDPAAERVRRKLMRFVVVNLGILFVAVMAVLGAVVYKSGMIGSGGDTDQVDMPAEAGPLLARGTIPLPSGSRVISHATSGSQLSLHVETAEGQSVIFVYDMAKGLILGEFAIDQ